MAVLGVWGLERDSSMGNDEVATRWAALLPLHQLAHLVNNVDAVHGLYYLLMHGWMAVGTSPAVMRIPSVISMVVAAGLIAILARQLTGSGWAALFAGLIMALTPTITYYAQTARSYALVYLCVVGATLLLLRALRAEHDGRPVVVGVGELRRADAAGRVPERDGAAGPDRARGNRAAGPVWADRVRALGGRGRAGRGAGAAAGRGQRPGGRRRRLDSPARPGRGAGPVPRLLRRDHRPGRAAVAVRGAGRAAWPRPGPVAGAAGPGPGRPWWRRGGLSVQSVGAPLLVLPGLVLGLESLVAHPLYVDRYVLYGEAGAALLAGAGAYRAGLWLAGRVRWPALVWGVGAVVCVLALVLQLGPQQRVRTPQSRLYDFGGPSRYVAAHAHQGDGVLFFSAFFRKARLGYPADFGKVSDFAMAVSPEQAGNFQGTDKPFGQVRPLMLAHQRIWVVGRSPFAQLTALGIRDEDTLLRSDFTLVAKHHFRHIWVTLWVRR